MSSSKSRSSFVRCLLVLSACGLLLCSCATTEGSSDEGGLFKGDDTTLAENHSYIQDSPHSAALEPQNWLSYSAYYLGEIALAPFRIIQMIIDGA